MPGYSLLGDPVQIDDRDACAFLFRIRLCLVHRFYRLHKNARVVTVRQGIFRDV